MIYLYAILAMPFNFILSSSHSYYQNTQCFFRAMPPSMILFMYAIPCILSYDSNKLTILYIHYLSHSMTNKFVMTFFLSIKYMSVCLYVFYSKYI